MKNKNITHVFLALAFIIIVSPSVSHAMTTEDVAQQFKLFKFGDPVSPAVLGASANGTQALVPAPKMGLSIDEKKVVMKGLRYAAGSSTIVPKSLKSGNTGDSVKKLQLFLGAQGHFNVEATGKYGAQTREAVMKFQKAKGLKADGKVGPITIKSITSDVESLTSDIKQ